MLILHRERIVSLLRVLIVLQTFQFINMNRLIIFVCTLIVHLTVIAAVTGSGLGYPVVLNGPQNSHLIDTEPEATIGFASGALTVTLDATHYAS